ncbi:DNRLRE domain-containing protein [Streptosporangium sp. NPDC001559]|uniref:DNRLRE domain-containing protein n=1 Tax=Streptosporangium sp. NPDC001559 TaxID=3366187 RepID=UPI0036ED692D
MENAKKQAKQQNKQVEIEALYTENTTTVANPDGKTMGTYVYAAPVRVKKDGAWKAVDTTLIEEGGVVRPKVSTLDVTLSAGGDTVLAKARTAKGETTLGVPNALPKPELSGGSATYQSVYGQDVDLVVTVTSTGVRQEIVIRRRPTGKLDLRLPVKLPKDVAYGKDSSGRATLPAVDGDGKEGRAAPLTPALLLDATAADQAGPLGDGQVSTVPTAVKQTAKGPELAFAPDMAFLNDPKVTYPVRLLLDSTDWYGPGMPSDTFVNNDTWHQGGPHQFMDTLVAGNGGGAIWRSYIRFNLTDAPFMGRKILNADVRPWGYRAHACGAEVGNIAVRRITSDWSMNTLDWSYQPSTTSAGQGLKGSGVGRNDANQPCPGLPSQEIYYSIEGIVQDWANGQPNYGLQVRAENENVFNYREYLSAEWVGTSGRGPVIFVKYENPEYLNVIRDYPAGQQIPSTSYAEDKAWVDAGNVYDDTPPGNVISPEQAIENAIANRSSARARLLDAYIPEGLSDAEIEEGAEPNLGSPPDTLPPPNPLPTPLQPTRVLNANPFFETESSPWTVTSGALEQSPDRAHETGGMSSAKITPENGGTEVVLRSEADIAVHPSYLHAVSGWFYPAGAETTIQYGIDWFDSAGSLISSSTSSHSLPADTWTPVSEQDFPPGNAAKAQVKLTVSANQSTPVLYADELKLLGPDTTSTNPPEEKTVSLPVQTDTWIDDQGSSASEGSVLWTGVYSNGAVKDVERTYLKFDTSSLAGKTIVDARLELWNAYSYGCGDSGSGIKAQRVTGAWDAATLSWGNQPSTTTSGEVVARDPGGCTDNPPREVAWKWPVTGVVRDWASGQANHGLLLRSVDESASAPVYDRSYYASESEEDPNTRLPVLKVTYTDGSGSTPSPTASPTPTDQPTQQTASLPVQTDTWIDDQGSSASEGSVLWTGVYSNGAVKDVERTYLKFDTSSLAGKTIVDARLELWNAYSYGCGDSGSGIKAQRVTGAWDAATLSWGNQPSTTTSGEVVARDPGGCTDNPPREVAWKWPVTGVVRDWASGQANHGLLLRSVDESASAPVYDRSYYASESEEDPNTRLPVLKVTYTSGAASTTSSASGPDTTVSTPSSGISKGTGGRAKSPSATPTLASVPTVGKSWVRPFTLQDGHAFTSTTTPYFMVGVLDSRRRRSAVSVEVAHDPKASSQGRGVIWSGVAENVSSGSTALLRIPGKRLADGWKVRWRARATADGVSGTWSNWQNLTVAQEKNPQANHSTGTSGLAASPKSAAYLKSILPVEGAHAPQATYNECRSAPDIGSNKGYVKNRFSYCIELAWYGRQYVGTSKIGEATGRYLYRISTNVDSREFEVSRKISVDTRTGSLSNASVEFSYVVKDSSAPGNPGTCERKNLVGMTGEHTLDEWVANTQEWHTTETFRSTGTSGPDEMGGCTIEATGAMRFPYIVASVKKSAQSDRPHTIRCDRAKSLNTWHNGVGKGGCVILEGIPAIVMHRNDVSARGVTFPEVYDHIKRALTNGGNGTDPKPGGRAFPRITSLKEIPGFGWGAIGDGKNSFLTREPYSTRRNANRAAATSTCDLEFGRRRPEGKGCDEFPFASTRQGAAYANPPHNYSVALVDGDENEEHGDVLNAWYQNNRILLTDIFWVDVQ